MRVFNRYVFVWGTQPLYKILQIQTSEVPTPTPMSELYLSMPNLCLLNSWKLAKDTEYYEHYDSDEEYKEP